MATNMQRLLLATLLTGSLLAARGQEETPTPQWRPIYHFTPAKNWMNDPNGLVDYQGEHHMFYQYNPFGNVWDFTISWGHAVSTDWVHWKELPVAIPATDTVSIFSGSAVVDKKNSSGFGTPANPPLVAIYAVYYRTAGIDPNDGSVIPLGTLKLPRFDGHGNSKKERGPDGSKKERAPGVHGAIQKPGSGDGDPQRQECCADCARAWVQRSESAWMEEGVFEAAEAGAN